ncbi:MAG: SAF domain-containing protein [Atopobiaceae bacterium]|nr:SAF domain-containing protein [Atopobiaceae bacterium]MDD3177514.1 SAF domain-containing protein [Atopobiaceae bacterium]MDD4380598.1 SAF domain-containing protein [Atopobiaceae bacterium]
MGSKLRIVIAVACATLAVMACVTYADGVKAEAESVRSEAIARYGGDVVRLVVCTKALEAGDVVRESDVTSRDWLVDLAPAEACTDLEGIVGTTLTVPAASGAPLTALNFRESGSDLAVPAGCVAVTVPLTDKLSLARNVSAGSTIAAYRAKDDGSAVLLATGLEVLTALDASSTTTSSRQQVTLAVPTDDISDVLAASASGDLRLVVPADDVDDLPADEVSPPATTSARTSTAVEPEVAADTAMSPVSPDVHQDYVATPTSPTTTSREGDAL